MNSFLGGESPIWCKLLRSVLAFIHLTLAPYNYNDTPEDVTPSIIKKLARSLKEQLVNNEDRQTPFMPYETAENVLTLERLQLLLRYIYGSGKTDDELKRYLNTITGEAGFLNSGRRKIISILLYSYDFEDENSIKENLSVIQEGTKNDAHLPFNKETTKELFGDKMGKSFFENQYLFLPIVLEQEEDSVHDDPHLRSPYSKERLIKEGNFGKVSMVRIKRGHFILKSTNLSMRNSEPIDLACKTFSGKAKYNDFKKERDTLTSIKNSIKGSPPHSIMMYTSSLVHGIPGDPKTQCSLFFPLAKCDLQDYLLGNNEALPILKVAYPANKGCYPSTPNERLDNISRMTDVLGGLKWLSEMENWDNIDHPISCYHCDLKPKNILVFRNLKAKLGTKDEIIFTITDFGSAKVMKPNECPVERSGSRNNRLSEGTYTAPEQSSSGWNPGKVDIWAFGCILFLILIHSYNGPTKVKEALHSFSEGYPSDAFHIKGGRKGKVDAYLNSYEQTCLTDVDKELAQQIVHFLREKLLVVDPYNRASPSAAFTSLRHIHDDIKSFPVQYRLLSSPKSPLSRAHSACGEYVALFSTGDIQIFVVDKIRETTDKNEIEPTLRLRVPINQGTHEWCLNFCPQTLCSSEWLLGITASLKFEVVLYNIARPWQQDVVENGRMIIRSLDVKRSDVQKVAISPDGRFIACSIKHHIYLFRTENLVRQDQDERNEICHRSRMPLVGLSRTDLIEVKKLLELGLRKTPNLGLAQGYNVEKLQFSDDSKVLAAAYTKDSTGGSIVTWGTDNTSQPGKYPFSKLVYSISDSSVKQENFQLTHSQVTGISESFLTSFALSNSPKGRLMIRIMHQQWIICENMSTNKKFKCSYDGKKLKAILPNKEGSKIVFLGSKPGPLEVYLATVEDAEITDFTTLHLPQVKEKIVYDPDKDDFFLLEKGDEVGVFISCAEGRSYFFSLREQIVS
ncbi:MAG: hypothetical protein M1834_000784 [Cirrosporium novae-zelandiae]|nr:MAG: hypothetical protein M1834_000784 [Cirrosporium novae-zelandiae]